MLNRSQLASIIHWHRTPAYPKTNLTSPRNLRFVLSLLQDRLHHFVSKLGSFGELGSEVLRNPLEAVPVGLEVAKGDAIRPCLEEVSTSIQTTITYAEQTANV